MNQTNLLKNISKHIQLNVEETNAFINLITWKEIPRKTPILHEGQPCKYLNYVHSGALRAFHIDTNGKESTIMFALEDWWVTDMFSYLNDKPAMMYIEAIEDSWVFQLNKENFETLFRRIPKFERFFRILMQNAYVREQLRIIENLSLTAEEKYKRFLAKYPQIAQSVTQKQIASYLGMTPEFLSAIRKKWSNNAGS